MSDRSIALAEDIRQVLASALMFDMRDPGLKGVTLTQVKLSPDQSYCDIRYTIMDETKGKKVVQRSLERAAGALKRAIGKHIKLRRMPNLRFHYDEMVEEERRIGAILNNLNISPADPEDGNADT